ncbi:MBL fold metallo-hydrolase [Gordonia sp. HY002]|uniref:MBL fold metallo-hydrolase n=1 Tax=Gordonia zhenghanii TaxID=2911516 RepID=UPI001EF0EEF7|nr:MBL fold metallo-hydrolase [Gordonia zhenghanii]MCF8572160.1 MBL fold metallo-hydrolase [Gordonia zhenghanii]MCF8606362.1 MBL fold metallo-hydrolase [Gordonia zhenghanii]
MRIRPGRPRLDDYARYFDLPAAPDDAPLTITWAGVTTLFVTDGTSSIMTDGFFTRPPLVSVGVRRLASSDDRIDAALTRLGVDRLDAVIPVHTHFDHALDSAAVAARTGAELVGGTSVAHLGHGIPDDRVRVVDPGSTVAVGAFDVTMIRGHHCPPDRYPGDITAPVVQPARVSAYRCGEAWSIVAAHRQSGRRALIVGSAGYVEGALAGQQADVVYLGIGQLGLQSESYIETFWQETVRAVGARRVVCTHWDDFFRTLDRPLRALPYAGDDLDVSMTTLARLAETDGVSLHLPALWQPVEV